MYSLTNKGALELRSLAKMSSQDLVALGKDVTLPVLEVVKVTDRPTVSLISEATGFPQDRVSSILKHLMSSGYIIPKPPKVKPAGDFVPPTSEPAKVRVRKGGRKVTNPESWFQKLSPEKKEEVRRKNRERAKASRSKGKAPVTEVEVSAPASSDLSIEMLRQQRRDQYRDRVLKSGKEYRPRGAYNVSGRSTSVSRSRGGRKVREDVSGYYLTQKGIDELNRLQDASDLDLKKSRRVLIKPVLEAIHTSPKPTFRSMRADTGLTHGQLAGTLANLSKMGYAVVPHIGSSTFGETDPEAKREAWLERYGGVSEGRRSEKGRVVGRAKDPLLDRFSDEVTRERLQIDLRSRLKSSIMSRFPDLDEASVDTMTDRVYRNIVG